MANTIFHIVLLGALLLQLTLYIFSGVLQGVYNVLCSTDAGFSLGDTIFQFGHVLRYK